MDYYFLSGKKREERIGRAGKRGGRLFFSLLFVPLLLGSCAGLYRQKENGGLGRFENLEEERTILLYPEIEGESPRFNIHVRLPDFESGAEKKNRPLAALIRETLYVGLSPGEYAEFLIADKTKEYNAMRKAPVTEAALNWEYSELIETMASNPRLLIFSRNREYFLGGAHGMREKKYFVLDTEKAEAVRLEDLIRPDARPVLEGLLAAALRQHAGLEAGASLSAAGFFEDTVEAPDNFFIVPEGLGFHWDPYEIAPYVMGSMELILPREKILPLLTPPYQAVLGN